VIRGEDHVLVHIDELEPAGVPRDEGWKQMDIRFFDGATSGSENTCLFRTVFPPGAAHERHFHPNADEFVYVISGRAGVGAGEEEHAAGPGSIQFIPAGKVHWLRNLDQNEPVELVGLYVGGASLEAAGYEYVGEITEEYRKAGAG
jgi:quercetin dioxygenase-like cupin family protein